MSGARGLALGAAALALAALVVARLLGGGDGRAADPPAVPGNTSLPSRAVPAAESEAHTSTKHSPGERVDERDAEGARQALPVEIGAPPASDGIRVRVVRVGVAVPEAEVLYLDRGGVDPLAYAEFEHDARGDHAAAVARFGRTFRTDREGRVVVPFPRVESLIGARHAGAWAQDTIAPLTSEVELALEPAPAFTVRLVDERGSAVPDERIALRQRLADGSYQALHFRRTDAEGRARFAHLPWLRADPVAPAPQVFVGAELLAAEPVQRVLDPAREPEQEFVLQLPGTGEVLLELIDSDGQPWHGEGEVEFALADDTFAASRAAGADVPVPSLRIPIRAGRAVLRVGLGIGLELFVEPHGWKQHLATVVGPTRAGESVVARVPLHAPAPTIRGRIVDPDGRPLSNESLLCELWSLRETQWHVEARRSDGDGRFAGFGGPYLQDEGAWALHFALARAPELVARVTLPAPVRAGPIELGDVVLGPAPLLVRGEVVDEDGRPVRAAELQFSELVEWPWEPGVLDWNPLPRGSLASAADGRFELRSWSQSPRLLLELRRSGYQRSPRLELTVPTLDLGVVLLAEGALAGRIVTARGRARDLANLSLRIPGFQGGVLEWEADGSFRFGGLRAGTYTLELRQWSLLPGVHQHAGIVVRAGETTQLAPIDLEQLVTVLRFDVRDPSGAALPEAHFAWPVPGATRPTFQPLARDADGRYELRTLELPLAWVRVKAPGHREAELTDVHADQRVVLEHGPRVQLALSGGLPALGEFWSLGAHLQRSEDAEAEEVVFDAEGRASLVLGSPGAYHVGLFLRHAGQNGRRSLDGLAWQIEVADSSGEQAFVSPAPTAAFLDHLAGLMR